MGLSSRRLRALIAACLLVGAAGVGVGFAGHGSAGAADAATPKAQCGPGSKPETGPQGRVSTAEVLSGRAAQGYTCNTEILGHSGASGGFKVFRYIDNAGHECAFYDSTLLFPTTPVKVPGEQLGVFVLDMSDPRHPVRTANLVTPAMLSPHESLSLNVKRGLLAADMGYPTFNPGFVDIYDVSKDCRHPVLKSSAPLGILGHEGNFSPDGNTFWVTSAGGQTMTALDVTDPMVPKPLFATFDYSIHGMNISDDGNRMYAADLGNHGLTIFDTSQVQQRVPNPKVPVVSKITWPEVSIPQNAIPVTIGGHAYAVEVDEYSRGTSNSASAPVGAARIIDIADEKHPKVVSNIRLEVNQPKNRATDQANDPGANFPVQGYAGHYCSVPSRAEPGVVACSFIMSGMRLFDIRDPQHPKEIAYANFPTTATKPGEPASAFVMCAPTFVPERGEVWFADGNSGFYNVHITNGVWPFKTAGATAAQNAPVAVLGNKVSQAPSPSPSSQSPSPPGSAPSAASGQLAVTGSPIPAGAAAVCAALGLGLLMVRRRLGRVECEIPS